MEIIIQDVSSNLKKSKALDYLIKVKPRIKNIGKDLKMSKTLIKYGKYIEDNL